MKIPFMGAVWSECWQKQLYRRRLSKEAHGFLSRGVNCCRAAPSGRGSGINRRHLLELILTLQAMLPCQAGIALLHNEWQKLRFLRGLNPGEIR